MKRVFRKVAWLLVIGFVAVNIVAFMHAWKFTHFAGAGTARTADPKELSAFTRVKILLTGIDNPRPAQTREPAGSYETITLPGKNALRAWKMSAINARGTVILFHGYSGQKSELLDRSTVFLSAGYNTWLVDFSGSGDSEGNVTSIGFHESAEVTNWYDRVKTESEKPVYLFGTSMGAAAILKAVRDENLEPAGIIIECPFGSLYQTVCARFTMMGVPKIPGYIGGALLSFWGGLQHGYWAFSHNPSSYAASVTSPILLIYGSQDDRVSRGEIDAIFSNLKGEKELIVYPDAGHDVFPPAYQKQWATDVTRFLSQH